MWFSVFPSPRNVHHDFIERSLFVDAKCGRRIQVHFERKQFSGKHILSCLLFTVSSMTVERSVAAVLLLFGLLWLDQTASLINYLKVWYDCSFPEKNCIKALFTEFCKYTWTQLSPDSRHQFKQLLVQSNFNERSTFSETKHQHGVGLLVCPSAFLKASLSGYLLVFFSVDHIP